MRVPCSQCDCWCIPDWVLFFGSFEDDVLVLGPLIEISSDGVIGKRIGRFMPRLLLLILQTEVDVLRVVNRLELAVKTKRCASLIV